IGPGRISSTPPTSGFASNQAGSRRRRVRCRGRPTRSGPSGWSSGRPIPGGSTSGWPTLPPRRAGPPRSSRTEAARYGKHMRLTIVGGGGFRVPLVYAAVARARDRVPITEVVLTDTDPIRLTAMQRVLADMRLNLPVRATQDLDDALAG